MLFYERRLSAEYSGNFRMLFMDVHHVVCPPSVICHPQILVVSFFCNTISRTGTFLSISLFLFNSILCKMLSIVFFMPSNITNVPTNICDQGFGWNLDSSVFSIACTKVSARNSGTCNSLGVFSLLVKDLINFGVCARTRGYLHSVQREALAVLLSANSS